MYIQIDMESEEALYMQLCNQIIQGIATSQYKEGDILPSVRSLAEEIGINMHTVNKAYSILREEGYLQIDRRKGTIIALNIDEIRAREELKMQLRNVLARSSCRNISRSEVHDLVDEIYRDYGGY